MSNQKNVSTSVTTGKVRLSYVNLFKPRVDMSGKNRYSVTLLIPKTDTDTLSRINAAIQAAAAKGVEGAWGGVKPPTLATPLHDGDGVRASGEPFGEECKGHWVMTASSDENHPPELVDQMLNPIIDQTVLYSGCYARVNVNFFPYGGGTTGFKKGIGAGLGPVQKYADGDVLGGSSPRASSVFDTVEDAFATPTTTAINPITGLPM